MPEGYSYKFNGAERLAFCEYPRLPDFYEIIYTGVTYLTPGAYPCSLPAGMTDDPSSDDPSRAPAHDKSYAIRGMDYSASQIVYTTDEGTPSNPAYWTELQWMGQEQFAAQKFGMASAVGNSTASIAGNCDMGVYVGLSGTGAGRNEQGYGLLLKPNGTAYLVQFLQGLHEPNYRVLTSKANVWKSDEYSHLLLQCWIDPVYLKGVYLSAAVNGVLMADCVLAGEDFYIPPTETSLAGWGIVAYNSTSVYTGNLTT